MPSRLVPIASYRFEPPCTDPDHSPSSQIYIPLGYKLEHTCPKCGKITTLFNNQPMFTIDGPNI